METENISYIVTKINEDTIEGLCINNMGWYSEQHFHLIEQILPIEITEEWLLKFGFEYRKKNSKVIMLGLTNEEYETTLQNWITTDFFQICRGGRNGCGFFIRKFRLKSEVYWCWKSEKTIYQSR
jgi:hypothetical protein